MRFNSNIVKGGNGLGVAVHRNGAKGIRVDTLRLGGLLEKAQRLGAVAGIGPANPGRGSGDDNPALGVGQVMGLVGQMASLPLDLR